MNERKFSEILSFDYHPFRDSFSFLYLKTLLQLSILYFSFCTTAELVVYILQATGGLRKIQPNKLWTLTNLWKECFWSQVCLIVGSFFVSYCIWKHIHNESKLYWAIDQHGYPFWLAQFVLTWLGNDAWQYWTHRFLHYRPIYRYVHKVHHQFYAPSVFATMSFHPIEAAVQFAPSIATIFIPVHVPSLLFSAVCFFSISVAEHSGYSLSSIEKYMGHRLFLSTPLHHDVHHQILRANYAVYFTFWDHLFSTFRGEIPDSISL